MRPLYVLTLWPHSFTLTFSSHLDNHNTASRWKTAERRLRQHSRRFVCWTINETKAKNGFLWISVLNDVISFLYLALASDVTICKAGYRVSEGNFFLDKFSLTSFVRSWVQQKIDNISLPRSFAPKLVMPAFGQGKFVRVLTPAKENLTNVQEILPWFWPTKCDLDVR